MKPLIAICLALWVVASANAATIMPQCGLILGRGDMKRAPAKSAASAAIESMLTSGTLSTYRPRPGDTLGDQQWTSVTLDANGSANRRGQYLYMPIESDSERIMILNAVGHGIAYFNGEPRAGDTYANGYVHVPILVKQGLNNLILRSSRGALRVNLYDPPSPCFLLDADKTLPDFVAGERPNTWGAVVAVNATGHTMSGFCIDASGPGLTTTTTELPDIPAMSVRKVGFRIGGGVLDQKGTIRAQAVLRNHATAMSSVPLEMNVTTPQEAHRRTFVSDIDGSVQYYALREAATRPGDPLPGIVLTCHGASVEAQGLPGAYAPKPWLHIVAPTNRRPYGFDWEDFGRADAMEVLGLAKASLPHDPSRIYLTGHSMGGHGAWHLATTFPDQFAAVAPSAGWISRDTYGGGRAGVKDDSNPDGTPMERIMARGTNEGRTMALAGNLNNLAIYILHGSIDDNVRVDQAQRMAKLLAGTHHDWQFNEVPGKNHWWASEQDDGGISCVDWPAMFDAFGRHALPPPGTVRQVSFVTANPGVSSSCHWLGIEAQKHQLELSSATLQAWPITGIVRGKTSNVAILRLDLDRIMASSTVTVELDDQTLKGLTIPEKTGTLWLSNELGTWKHIDKPGTSTKNPARYGSIKDELKHRFMLVYATHGTAEENAWAFAKARFDSETFWTRGNGSIDVIEDFKFDPDLYPDRTVVLYGNRDTNSAWKKLLADSPVQARRDEVRIGDRKYQGHDLGLVFIRPRADSSIASVVAIAGTGIAGMRSLYATSLFVPFTRYPDCMLTRAGRPEPLLAGYFGPDWSLDHGEFVD